MPHVDFKISRGEKMYTAEVGMHQDINQPPPPPEPTMQCLPEHHCLLVWQSFHPYVSYPRTGSALRLLVSRLEKISVPLPQTSVLSVYLSGFPASITCHLQQPALASPWSVGPLRDHRGYNSGVGSGGSQPLGRSQGQRAG